MLIRRCNHCKESKPNTEFYKTRTGGTHYSAWCRVCVKQRSKEQAETGYFRERHRRLAAAKSNDMPRKRLTPLERLAFRLWHNAQKRAFRAGWPFDLTRETVWEHLEQFCAQQYHVLAPRHPFRPSLDRIDHKRSYMNDNVRIIWLIENYAKNVFTEEQLVEFCQRKLGLL